MTRAHRIIASVALGLLAAGGCTPATPVGPPPQSFGTSVFAAQVTKHPNEAIDVVLAPDDDYGDMNDLTARQAFVDQVGILITSGFGMNQAWNLNSDEVNFWYMTLSGDVQPGTGTCPSVTWPSLTDAAFAEVIVLLHPNPLRDCAWGDRVTSEPTSFTTIVHEASHAVFGLPDEYCCDGGYWNAPPIVYSTEANCLNDANNSAWRQCQSIPSVTGTTWWRSEDSTCDIMACGGSVVMEYGPGDWAIVEQVFSGLPNASISAPSVFAPNTWP
ncbi:MAG TPA: hypothetical protein VFI11_13095 [Anaerolineales bacterium]|nr:hypothetical protein [Anaerolineales bacterium]